MGHLRKDLNQFTERCRRGNNSSNVLRPGFPLRAHSRAPGKAPVRFPPRLRRHRAVDDPDRVQVPGALPERGAGRAERIQPGGARRDGAGLVSDARPARRQPSRARRRRPARARHADPVAYSSRAWRVRLRGVARLRGTGGTGPRRTPCSGHARHRRGPRPRAFAPRDQPRVAAPPAGHLRGSPRDAALKEGIVLFAHGSRDPEWARPFQRMSEIVGRTAPHCVVRLAYLEIMRPSLEEAVAALAKSVKRIRVVPVFLGQGSHLKEDLPRLIAAVRGDYPGVEISLEPAIGEQPRIIEAIATLIAGR